MRRFLAVGVAAVLLLGCGDDDSNEPQQTLTGTWGGQIESATLRLTLKQASTDVTGDGAISAGTTTLNVTATGTATRPNFALTLSAPGFSSVNFSGSYGANTMTGTANGSGYTNVAVTLTRQ